jgi:hypothetical protein
MSIGYLKLKSYGPWVISVVRLGDNMKKLLLTSVAALFLATGAARSVEIPKQYRGAWCETNWRTIYKRCLSADFEIKRTYWTTVEPTCTLSAIRKSKYGGHRLSAICKSDEGSRDMPNHAEVHWWLGSNNTRLQAIIKDPDFCEDGGCTDAKGRICYELSNCCKNSHDWATEQRDKTVCHVKGDAK